MKKLFLAAFVALLALPSLATAHGPTPQKVEESILIPAPPDAVWKVMGNFGSIGDWHPEVKKVTATGDNTAGTASRTITLEKGDITEGLDEYDAADHRYAYRMSTENIEALPVSFYTAEIQVKPADGGSQVTWGGRFYRADTTNEPAEGQDDQSAIDAMTDFFKKGLDGLKAKVAKP
ncbi:SRPBCC family protein [Ancylobacter sp. 6x-1]|uniref:SRPBCC family protein n=1 Tax=Ancylobacter crimeensis TaxID=2579147 RepID=A0ABT0DDJ0_9HYPH|nr:SRPBCC family protein [Ancylobacter crimeensis]MCK0197949.1 SRPBCC family protein [Ancylobacter crimeensis]